MSGCLNAKEDEKSIDIVGLAVIMDGTLLPAESENNKIKSISPQNKILSVLELPFGNAADIAVLNQTMAGIGIELAGILFILNMSDPAALSIEKQINLGYEVKRCALGTIVNILLWQAICLIQIWKYTLIA